MKPQNITYSAAVQTAQRAGAVRELTSGLTAVQLTFVTLSAEMDGPIAAADLARRYREINQMPARAR